MAKMEDTSTENMVKLNNLDEASIAVRALRCLCQHRTAAAARRSASSASLRTTCRQATGAPAFRSHAEQGAAANPSMRTRHAAA